MAVTESPPEVVTTDAAAPVRTHSTGLAKLLGSGDHKVIGRAFIVTSLLFGLAAIVTGQLVAVENVDTSRLNILSADTEFQVFTFHSVSATFLFLLPLMLGLAYVVVPLQVGASTIAFPRAAAASFWAWLIAGALVVTSYLINGGPGGGRTRGVDLWIVALAAVLAALLLGAACLVTTVFGLRAPGMSLGRVPMFAWSMLVA
jgi:cytochrome c oxidase subunit 1